MPTVALLEAKGYSPIAGAYEDINPYTRGDNDGTIFVADFADTGCYPGGSFHATHLRLAGGNPTDEAIIYNQKRQAPRLTVLGASDNAARSGDARFNLPSGSVAYANKRMDFTGSTGRPTGVRLPNTALAQLYAQQYFMVWAIVTFPASGDYISSGSVKPIISACASDSGYTASAEFVQIDMRPSSPANGITFRRPVSAGVLENTNGLVLTPDVTKEHRDKECLVAYARNAAGSFGIVMTPTGNLVTPQAVYANSTSDFSALELFFGHPQAFSGGTGATGYVGLELFACGLEDLYVSGRDPMTVLTQEYARFRRRLALGYYA